MSERKMMADEAATLFSSYSQGEQAEFVAQLIYELTLVVREEYEAGGEGLSDTGRVRRANELQHRLSAFLWALLRGDAERYADEVLVRIVLEQPDDDALGRMLGETFARLAAQPLTAA
jgi:hypothetical protein